MTGRLVDTPRRRHPIPPAPLAKQNKKSAEMEGCGQRYGTECAEGEETAKDAGAEVMLDLCFTITGEESAEGGREDTQRGGCK